MSDNELIIRLLKEVEGRTRLNRILHEVARSFAMAMLVPVLFKILDLFVSFRTTTVMIVFAVWFVATIVWIVYRTRGVREPLHGIAANVDMKSGGHDQLKTAYW